jgi:hypothetical protein
MSSTKLKTKRVDMTETQGDQGSESRTEHNEDPKAHRKFVHAYQDWHTAGTAQVKGVAAGAPQRSSRATPCFEPLPVKTNPHPTPCFRSKSPNLMFTPSGLATPPCAGLASVPSSTGVGPVFCRCLTMPDSHSRSCAEQEPCRSEAGILSLGK